MAEIQRADARRRRLVILVLVVMLIGSAALWMVFEGWMVEVRGLPVEAARRSLSRVFVLCMGIMIICVGIVGWHCWQVGERVRQTLRFPPPDAKVVRDTVVFTGQIAAARGRLLKVLGLILMFCMLALGMMSWWVFTIFHGVLR